MPRLQKMGCEPSANSPSGSILRAGFSWRLALEAEGRSPRTVGTYLETLRLFVHWCEGERLPTDLEEVCSETVRLYLANQLATNAPATANLRYRGLNRFFVWCVNEQLLDQSPLVNVSPPRVPEKRIAILEDAELAALLKVTAGTDFDSRRDHAIIRLFIDTGMRRAELLGLAVDDVDFELAVAIVVGKGGRPRSCPFGSRTGQAIDRYLRQRAKHRSADDPALWLGARGRLGQDGVRRILDRRSQEAGVDGVYAHRFRHTFAHRWLAEGGEEGDLMRLTGWTSRGMLDRYGAATAAERARSAHQRMRLGDRL